MKTKIQIKTFCGKILFEFEKENNTIKDTIEEAVKQKVNLCDADLRGADLQCALLCGVNLRGAFLQGADLRRADLRWTNLRGTYLCGANLRWADLYGADLSKSNLRWANLQGALIREANLCSASLSWAENVPYIPLNCPSEGAFVAWKKVKGKLVKLEIPEDAKRSSATSNKCRCDKAKVLSITDLAGSNPIDKILNTSQEHELLYKVGEMVYPDSFDEDRWNECSHGIHFFINKQDAIDY